VCLIFFASDTICQLLTLLFVSLPELGDRLLAVQRADWNLEVAVFSCDKVSGK
jgi:hypothetical protein